MDNNKKNKLIKECDYSTLKFFLDNNLIDIDKLIDFIIKNNDESYASVIYKYSNEEERNKILSHFKIKSYNPMKSENEIIFYDFSTIKYLLDNGLFNLDFLVDFIINKKLNLNFKKYITFIGRYVNIEQFERLLGYIIVNEDSYFIYTFCMYNIEKSTNFIELICRVLIIKDDTEVILEFLLQNYYLDGKNANLLIDALDIGNNFYYIISLLNLIEQVNNYAYLEIIIDKLEEIASNKKDKALCSLIKEKINSNKSNKCNDRYLTKKHCQSLK